MVKGNKYEGTVHENAKPDIEYRDSFYVGKNTIYFYNKWNHNVCFKWMRKGDSMEETKESDLMKEESNYLLWLSKEMKEARLPPLILGKETTSQSVLETIFQTEGIGGLH